MNRSRQGCLGTVLGVWSITLALAGSANGQLLFEDNFNKTGPPCCDNIDPDASDAPGRQSGSEAPLNYIEDPDHEHPGGSRNNMTQVNNPDYPNALLLAPSNDFGFEQTVFAQPDHDFLVDPGPGNRMVIEVDMNPVHDSAGVQVTGAAAAALNFTIGEISLFDHGGWSFSGPAVASGDLDPLDAGGAGGTFAGFHNVRVELITDAFVLGNPLDIRVLVDGSPLAIDNDGSPTVLETSVSSLSNLSVRLSGKTDANAPGKVGGFTVFTLHGFDNLRVAIDQAPMLLLGDANKDGQVTGADLISVQQNFGSVGAVPLQGDANNDGQVTGADLISVQQNFGNVLSPASSSVPEPSTLALLGIGTLLALRRRGA